MPVFEVDAAAPPVTCVQFSNGTTNEKVEVKSYTKEESSSGTSNLQQILSCKVDGISYVGKNFGAGNFFPTDSCNYYVGIHDKSSGKIRVVPASLVQLEPWFAEKEAGSNMNLSSAASTYNEKYSSFNTMNNALTADFGSGRSQKAIWRRLQEKLEDEVVTSTAKTAMSASSSSVTEENSAAPAELQMQSDAIPPHNTNAKTPDEVYLLKDIVSREVLSCLTDVSSALTCCTKEDLASWRREQRYFSFILDKLEGLSDVPKARQLQGQCLMYLQYLMELYMMKAHELRFRYPLPKEWPIQVKDHLLKFFTLEIKEPGKKFNRCFPGRKKDLLLSHIMVMCLKMSEFCLDITPLMADLKHAARKLTSHASSLGCVTKKTKRGEQDVHTVTLKVPLTFPTVKGKLAKRRIF